VIGRGCELRLIDEIDGDVTGKKNEAHELVGALYISRIIVQDIPLLGKDRSLKDQ